MQVDFTAAALDLVGRVMDARPGARFVFVFGTGCCEGTAPHLFADHHVGPTHACVGRAGDVPVYADDHVRGIYGVHRLLVDAEEDPLADGFSAEVALGWRFVLRT